MKAAVLGSPVRHSLSPVLHRAAYAALGLTGWTYEAIDCDAARLAEQLRDCGPDWAGLSLTMPLKQAVLPLLDSAEPLVAQVAGANTVVFTDGARRGFNTDVPGIMMALTVAGAGLARPAVILGAGATARAALAALHGLGAREATVAVRDPARAAGMSAAAGQLGMTITLRPFTEPGVPRGYLLISTVPAGAADKFAQRLSGPGPAPAAVLDVVYHPWPTRLAMAAGQSGAIVIGGFEMLLYQAAGQVELMTGHAAPTAVMRAAGLAEIERRGAGPGPAAARPG
jgi:shikimate dehydrogenase